MSTTMMTPALIGYYGNDIDAMLHRVVSDIQSTVLAADLGWTRTDVVAVQPQKTHFTKQCGSL